MLRLDRTYVSFSSAAELLSFGASRNERIRNGRFESEEARVSAACVYAPWHFLYFLPEPQGQGSLRPTLSSLRWTVGADTGSSPRFSVSLGCGREITGAGGGAERSPSRTACTRKSRSIVSDLIRSIMPENRSYPSRLYSMRG